MSIIGILLIIIAIAIIIFNHYKPSQNHPQAVKFTAFLSFIVGFVIVCVSIITFFNC